MKYNNELRVINTQEKAYLLGFMYGDGTITTYVEKTGRIRHLTKISISIEDQDLILLIKKHFPFFNLGDFDYGKYNKNSGKQVSVARSSKELYNDLLLNGVYPRKSYENKDKLHMPNIAPDLISHFIRGFFDADGTVYVPVQRPNLLSLGFCSVAKDFIYEIDSYLKSIGIESWKIRDKHPSKGRQTCYELIYNKTSEILKLINFMYRDANISLKRKADKCLNYVPLDKVLERNMTCGCCGSHRIKQNGTRGNSTRYKCCVCKKSFSLKNTFN
jgi:intein-encoded DNA endonuclease-like protein